MPKNDAMRVRKERREAIAKEIAEAQGTPVQVAEEGMLHIMENYVKPHNPYFKEDYVLVLYGGFYGHHKQNGQPKAIHEHYFEGDMHACAHKIAELMKVDKVFRVAMLHAIEMWASDEQE